MATYESPGEATDDASDARPPVTMTDGDCVEFLQWALPKMRMRWPGFRKVRGQVCKRIMRRMVALGLPSVSDYRAHLETHPAEWNLLSSLCRVTISRFYRDRAVFDYMATVVLPSLAKRAQTHVRCWSVGCASGEEAYTVQLLWMRHVAPATVGKTLHVLGTDADPILLERANRAVYPASSLKSLASDLVAVAFERSGDTYVLNARFKEDVEFEERDIRSSMPPGPFDLILCRNLVFTYFEEALQREILQRLVARLRGGGVLVTGAHETVPPNDCGLAVEARAVYAKTRG